MDSVNRFSVTPRKTKLATKFAKVLHIRAAKTIDEAGKIKSNEKLNHEEDEKLQNRASMDAFIAKVFATLSSVKAAYAELQYSQSPYDPEGIQSADQLVVSELKSLSELKQYFLKNHIHDPSPGITISLSEIQERKNLIKTYGITKKQLANQRRLKDSEIVFLKEKLEEFERKNKLIERRLNSSGHEINLHLSKATTNDFVLFLKHAMKSVRSFVKLMITEMEYANWDLNAAADSIQPNVVYGKTTDKCFAIESFVCLEMFDDFDHPSFSISKPTKRRRFFLDEFMELKYLKAREYIAWKPTSTFAKFCWFKYLKLVHPKMESSLFGNLNQRKLVSVGKYPETMFFETFSEAAKRVWLLHCLAFSLDPNGVSIFQARNGCRFSEVLMECVNEEAFLSPESRREVAFTVVPGFKLGKSVVQCQVYVS